MAISARRLSAGTRCKHPSASKVSFGEVAYNIPFSPPVLAIETKEMKTAVSYNEEAKKGDVKFVSARVKPISGNVKPASVNVKPVSVHAKSASVNVKPVSVKEKHKKI